MTKKNKASFPQPLPVPPACIPQPITHEAHGLKRTDPYDFLRQPDWLPGRQDESDVSEEITDLLKAENAYANALLAPVKGLRQELFAEMKGRIKENDDSVPAKDGPFEYFSRFETGKEYPVFFRRALATQKEELLLDVNVLAEGKNYFQVAGLGHSPDHKIIGYGFDEAGDEKYTLVFKDLETGEMLPDRFEDTSAGWDFFNDSETIAYVLVDDNNRPNQVKTHRLGTPLGDDPVLFEDSDSGRFVGIGLTEDEKYLAVQSGDHQSDEIWLMRASGAQEPLNCLFQYQLGNEYDISHHEGFLYVHTNIDGAENHKIVRCPLDKPTEFEEVVPHDPNALIENMLLFKDYLVYQKQEAGLPVIYVRHLQTGHTHTVDLPGEVFDVGLIPLYEFDTPILRLGYSSLNAPHRIYDYHMGNRDLELRKEREIPSGHNPDDYVVKRLMAPAADGEEIPISLMYHKEFPPSPERPLLLYGYGAYGMSMSPGFSGVRLSLVQRGVTYAMTHIRGGQEKGYRWYREGREAKKKNTFNDFLACADHLIKEQLTSEGRIVAGGGSAGGMLIGNVINQRPELFGVAVLHVPFVDVLNTMCDASLPLTPMEWPEWGNPIEDKEAYEYIESYSPYDNLKKQSYPIIWATAGLSDPRVTYWEPLKWIQRLRTVNTSQQPTALLTEMEAGHSGTTGRFKALEECARDDAFVLLALCELGLL